MSNNWTQEERLKLLQMIADGRTVSYMSHALRKSATAVQLYAYRNRLPLYKMVKNPLMRRLVEMKFGKVEYFSPTREFYRTTGINQKRWQQLIFGYDQPSYEELMLAAKAFNIPEEEVHATAGIQPLPFDTEP